MKPPNRPKFPARFRLATPFLAALIGLVLVLVAGGCRREREHHAEFLVFGTIMEVKTWGADDDQAARLFSELQQMFQAMHRDWHAWEPGQLAEINRAFATGQSARADARIIELVRRSQAIEQGTKGRFNPAIGQLIALWGFHTSEFPVIGPPPDGEAIERLLVPAPSTADIIVDGLELRSTNPMVRLDFGGIAKGYAVDLAIGVLRDAGIANAIVNAGGDLRAMGVRGDRPWRVAVRKPGGGVIGAIEVSGDEALFTSGNYERFRQDETRRYPHILDPRTGWPVQDVASVTVVAGEGLLADAAATALVVAGIEDWPVVTRALGLDQVMVVDEAGTVYLTPAMAARVRFVEDLEPVIVNP